MKKFLYTAAILATFASCSKNEADFSADLAPENAISFATLNDRVSSRVANNNNSNYQVYAVGDESTDWFMNEEIVGSGTDANSIKDGSIYYWPKDELNFLAIAPATDASLAVTNTFNAAGEIVVDYANPAAGDIDLTAAQALGQTGPNAVDLAFQHQLAKIIVRVSLNSGETEVGGSMEGWSINNLVADKYESTDTEALLSTQLTVNNSEATYTFSATNAAGAYVSMDKPTTLVPQTLTAQNHTASGEASDLNIVPQDSKGCKIALTNLVVRNANGVIMNNADNATYTIEAGNVSTKDLSADYFHPGKVYILDIMLSFDDNSAGLFNGEILFDSSCDDWINAGTGDDWPTDDSTTDNVLWD